MMVLEGLIDFETADQDAPIETFPPVAWEEIKNFCLNETRRIGGAWFEAEWPKQ